MPPHRQQPTRLPHPWDSPGKNTGVGCHVLLQCMKVKSEREVAQSCLILSDPMDCSLPGSSVHVHGIFQARVLEWVAIAFSLELWTFVNSSHPPPCLSAFGHQMAFWKRSLHQSFLYQSSPALLPAGRLSSLFSVPLIHFPECSLWGFLEGKCA